MREKQRRKNRKKMRSKTEKEANRVANCAQLYEKWLVSRLHRTTLERLREVLKFGTIREEE